MAVEPDQVRLGMGLRASEAPAPDKASLHAPDFFLRAKEPWFRFERELTCPRADLLEALRAQPRTPWRVRDDQPPCREAFRDAYHRAHRGIEHGRWTKVVPYGVSTFRAEIGAAEVATALERLLSLPPALMPYGFWTREEGLLGATPERLLQKRGREVRSVAMAGTRQAGSTQPPLLSDPKQRAEHRAVVDDIEHELRSLGPVTVGPREVASLLDLEHLQVEIRATLEVPLSFEGLVQRLHPTPALGASPRGAADRLLEALDGEQPRWRFGAPFGWRTPEDDGLSVVAIRNVQWRGDQARIATGCGVVAASAFEDEWNELLAKQRSIRRLLAIG